MKICTVNIRYENNHDGINSWSNRRCLLANFINEKNFDFIGTQEGRRGQILDLASLVKLKLIEEHRHWIEERMYPSIFFNSSKYAALKSGDIWLSDTPSIPGSTAFKSTFPRLATWVKLENIQSHFKIFLVNVHLDHVLEETRIEQTNVMISEIRKHLNPEEKLIILGDFNDSPRSIIYSEIIKNFNLTDPWVALNAQEESSHHGFIGENIHGHRIDWILLDHHFECERIYLDKTHFNQTYLSDHFPVVATLIPSWI
jgi:endonuclease/exonuclease/phosphatase family metal-dependent hydrolase